MRYDLNWGILASDILSALEESEFLIYLSISWRSEPDKILLVIITIPLSSTQMKSANMLDLIALRAQLILVTYEFESLINSLAISLFIGMITCFCDKPLVVMVILSLVLLFDLLMTFWTCLILLLGRFRNIFLIFNVSLTMFFRMDELCWLDKEVVFAYNFFYWGLEFFLKYFEISLTSFYDLARIRERIREINVGFTISFFLLLMFKFLGTQGVSLELTLFLKILLVLSVYKLFQWES